MIGHNLVIIMLIKSMRNQIELRMIHNDIYTNKITMISINIYLIAL